MKGDRIYFILPSPAKLLLIFPCSLYFIRCYTYLIQLLLNLSSLERKKKTLFVFPLDSLTGARVSWLEMDQCVSSALRWKHYGPLWSLGKHTRAHMHKCAHIITHSMFLYIAKTIFKGGSIILWHLTNWIMGKWSLGFLTGRHCAISILMTFRRS